MRLRLRHPAVTALAGWYGLLVVLAWMAPYSWREQHREFSGAPPTPVRMGEIGSDWGRLYVCAMVSPVTVGVYEEDCRVRHRLAFLQRTDDGRWALFRAEPPGVVFVLGTDELGRDVFSRAVAGGLVTLATGLSATFLALLLALVSGCMAGMFGGWLDIVISRGAELLMALPALYLLLALRAALPLQTPPLAAFALAVGLISVLGWARPARLFRGVVMSAKSEGFVLAARGFGAGPGYLLRRHIFPRLRGVLGAQAAILVPQFMLIEVAMSFLGLGVAEPVPSWGTMLSSVQYDLVADRRWWFAFPAVLLTVSTLLSGRVAKSMELRWHPAEPTAGETKL